MTDFQHYCKIDYLSHLKSPPATLKHRTGLVLESPAFTMPTSPSAAASSVPNDGILVQMPREIRDETYRYLVKGSYILYRPPYMVSAARDKALRDRGNLEIDHDGPNFNILRVSKAFNLEARRVLYTESSFKSWIDFAEYTPYQPLANKITDGMMNLKFNIFGLGEDVHSQFSPEVRPRTYQKNMEDICRDTLDHFTGTEITRNYVHILFYPTFQIETELNGRLFRSLENLSNFRKVKIEFCSSFFPGDTFNPQRAIDHQTRVTQAIRARLEPALGPAVAQQSYNPRHTQYHVHLTFHPHRSRDNINS